VTTRMSLEVRIWMCLPQSGGPKRLTPLGKQPDWKAFARASIQAARAPRRSFAGQPIWYVTKQYC
jgi:hypothetical protein